VVDPGVGVVEHPVRRLVDRHETHPFVMAII